MNSSPTRRGSTSLDQIKKTVTEFNEFGTLKVVVFAGGEPTLRMPTLVDALSHCRSLNLFSRVVTNAHWATTPDRARKVLSILHDAGLAELNISCDDQHAPYITFGRVINAWKAAKEFSFKSVVISHSSGPHSALTAEMIESQLGETIPKRFDENGRETDFRDRKADSGTIYAISNGTLGRIGRAAQLLPEEHFSLRPSSEILELKCPSAIAQPALTPNGTLVACCGYELVGNPFLEFGHVDKTQPSNLVRQANMNLVARAMRAFGPGYFVKLLHRTEGIKPQDGYTSICDACFSTIGNPKLHHLIQKHLDIVRMDLTRSEAPNDKHPKCEFPSPGSSFVS